MSDHNFEKQIRQKLDELKVPPAGTVWSSVEAQIRKDKRRRRGLILFPVLLLLIGAGSYFIFQDNLSSTNNSGSKYVSTSDTSDATDNNNSGVSDKSKTKQELQDEDRLAGEVNEVTKQPEIKDGQEEKSNTAKTLQNQQDAKKAGDNATVDKSRASNTEPGSALPVNRNATVTKKNTNADKKWTKPGITTDQEKNDHNLTERNQIVSPDRKQQEAAKKKNKGQSEEIISKGNKPEEEVISKHEEVVSKQEEVISKDKENTPVPDSQANKTVGDVEDNRLSDSTKADILAQNKPADSISPDAVIEKKKAVAKNIKQSSWKWGLTGSAGISNLNDGSFFDGIIDGISGEKALVADVSPNVMNSAPSPTAIIHKPSPIEKGFSFSVGAFVQKNLSKRFSISTGLQYSYYSTNIRVGNRVDSSASLQLQNAFGALNVSQYYRSAPVPATREFTNRFHFIELPVSIYFQLNKGNRLPVFWNAGLSLSYLVSTNALHFDSQTGVYYKDNDLFNKLQANLSTGLSVSLWNKSKMPIHVGPQLQYGLTNLMKQEVSSGKHLFYFGLNTKIFLKK